MLFNINILAMRKHFILLCLLWAAASSPTFAQTQPEKDLEAGVLLYNNLRDYTSKLKPSTITEADISYVNEQVSKGVALLDPLTKNESGSTADVARYFRTNLIYEKGFMLGMKGRQRDALDVFKTIETDVNSFTSSRFPLRYTLGDKKYVVNWDNYAPTQGEFNVSMCEFYYTKKDYDSALPYARKAVENAYLQTWNKTLASGWLMKMKIARNETDRELLDAALNALDAYSSLDGETRESGGTTLSKLPDEAADAIERALNANPGLANGGESWARGSRLLLKEKKDRRALDFAAKALQAGYRDRTFAEETANKAAAMGDRAIAKTAIDQLASMTTTTDCSALAKLASLYQQIGDKNNASIFQDKSDACDRRNRREARAASRDGGLYIGAYLFPLFRKDWGLVGAIQTRKVLIEGSYQEENHNRDRLLDLWLNGVDGTKDERVYWDGYYAHLAISGIREGKRGGRPYMGALFGYNLREYETITTNVYDEDVLVGPGTFKPRETRYILMYNIGLHSYGKLLASDVYFSLGGSYNQFDRGNDAYKSDHFTFDNLLLRERKKNRIGFMVRIGLTVGFQFGPRTFGK